MNKYLLEFMGVVVILYSKILTDANPVIMGLVYFACFYMTSGITTGYFTPLGPTSYYLLGRMSSEEFMYNLGVQILGMLCVVITFLPVSRFLENV